ncbi:neutral zinc metallopeptidase [Streptosporangium sp. NPDC023615]|uniref:neutral zinc metallopeptidase n=1 Tax=Streptosporangium sp. NPDC023615 TaxID=3154794 RepID=UPI00341D2DAB
MRIRTIIAMAGAAGMLLTGTAHAYPVKNPALTENALYDSGTLAASTCTEPPIKDGSRAQAERYMKAMVGCLNTAWEGHITTAGMSFGAPKVKFFDRLPRKYCGFTFEKDPGSYSLYCPRSRTIAIRIGKDWLENTDDLWLLHHTAALYGYHVASLSGIHAAYDKTPYANKSEMYEQIRRFNLYSDCLGGVFIRSVQDSLGRDGKDWKKLLSVLRGNGDLKGQARTYGKGSNRAAWTARGHAGSDLAACNTWAAPSSQVA